MIFHSSSFLLGCGAPLAASCPPGKWECPALAGVCIDLEKICDDKLDCPNGADEGPGCDNIECDRYGLKFIYSEKATKFCEIFTSLLSKVQTDKNKVKISQKCVAFPEYMNFNYISILLTIITRVYMYST